jgi:TetR/AcrR family transcriptional regulator, regulator of cefoperazone and chloramphenicol sensitivity
MREFLSTRPRAAFKRPKGKAGKSIHAIGSADLPVVTGPQAQIVAPRRTRAGGAEARQQLMTAGLRLFSEKGFAKTSTRAIAEAACVNIASISYYFGDKAGLYRAMFKEPMGGPGQDHSLFAQSHFTLRESLAGFIGSFLEPMKQDELVQQCMRLHFREMLEPTGVWAHEIDQSIKPAHAALLALLGGHLGVKTADDDLHRLAFSIAGLAMHLYMTRDVVQAIRPRLLKGSKSIDVWAAHMVEQAEAMVDIEAARRSGLKK